MADQLDQFRESIRTFATLLEGLDEQMGRTQVRLDKMSDDVGSPEMKQELQALVTPAESLKRRMLTFASALDRFLSSVQDL